jgi:type II secretion system protein G
LRKSGFTLIELLIVVAVIAILAAIAVPNFLEAQTRSKVSRAQSDMRTIAIAAEALAVDKGKYPRDGDDIFPANPLVDFDSARRLRVLTTPVAYLEALPHDPFHNEFDGNPPLVFLFPGAPPYTYAYNTFGAYNEDPIQRQPANKGRPDNFTLTSLGPNRLFDSLGGRLRYDPTNGTISAGDLFHSGGRRIDRDAQ